MLSYKGLNLIISLSIFFISACSYQPLININQIDSSVLQKGQFVIFSSDNDAGFYIKEKLLVDFGFPKNPKYKIILKSSLERRKSIITEKNNITRYNLILNSTFKLIEIKTGKQISLKEFITETSFSASTNITGFKAEVAKDNAEKRLAYDMAEKIRMEILILAEDLSI